ncbi:ABC transporter substrate-binding protein [Ottowia thiooxydans]|uniref:ABC transporter substrate-binding protein n=1 Tax=Ottowia thiooxydans TaxID=219182 RepID=UPI000428F210|nr:ABC transporter substrate-binding protein [Ottowia thiooxydans]
MTNFFARRFAVGTIAAVAALLLAPGVQAQAMKTVGVTAIVDHPALDAARKGVQDELKALGWEEGKNLKLSYQSAQGNSATAGQIARKFAGDKVDVIVAVATPSAQAAVAATKTIPVVFTAVTDPVAAKLVKSWQPSGTNVTGASDALPLAAQIDLLLKVKPGAKRVGYVYSPGEVNSTIVLKELKTELTKRGMTVVEAAAPRTVDIPSAAKSLVGKVDVIYTTTDNNVVSAYESMVRVAEEADIPLVAADTDSVKRGAVAALGMSYYDLGRQTGKIVDRILKGAKAGSIAPEVGTKMSLVVNPGAAEKQGVKLPEALIKEAAEVVK